MNLDTRAIFLSGDLNEEATPGILAQMFEYDAVTDDAEYLIDQKFIEPIKLVIDSYGGDIYAMWTLYDAMCMLNRPIHTIGLGKVMSGSVLLLAAGKKGERIAGRNTTFMVHAGSVEALSGKAHEALEYIKHVKSMDQAWYNIMKSLTSNTVDWKEICSKNTDFYFDAYQALEFGIIDKII